MATCGNNGKIVEIAVTQKQLVAGQSACWEVTDQPAALISKCDRPSDIKIHNNPEHREQKHGDSKDYDLKTERTDYNSRCVKIISTGTHSKYCKLFLSAEVLMQLETLQGFFFFPNLSSNQ